MAPEEEDIVSGQDVLGPLPLLDHNASSESRASYGMACPCRGGQAPLNGALRLNRYRLANEAALIYIKKKRNRTLNRPE